MKPLRILATLSLGLGILASLGAADATAAELERARGTLRDTLRVLDAQLTETTQRTALTETYREIRPALAGLKVQFDVDPQDRSLLQSVQVYPGSPLRITVGIAAFRLETTYPGILTGFLGQAYGMAWSRVTTVEAAPQPSEVQRVFDSLDALYLHAMAVRDLVVPRKRALHPLERFLLESLEKDQNAGLQPLSVGAMLLLGVDAELVGNLATLGGSAQAGQVTVSEYLQKVRALVDRLVESSESVKQLQGMEQVHIEARYYAAVSAVTMMNYGLIQVKDHLERFYAGEAGLGNPEVAALNRSIDRLNATLGQHRPNLAYQYTVLQSLGL